MTSCETQQFLHLISKLEPWKETSLYIDIYLVSRLISSDVRHFLRNRKADHIGSDEHQQCLGKDNNCISEITRCELEFCRTLSIMK